MAILIEQIPSQNSLAQGRCPRGRFGSAAINTAAFLNSSLIGALINKQSPVVGGQLRMPAPDLPLVLCFQEFSCSLAVLCRPEPCRNVVSLGGQPRSSSYQKWTKSGPKVEELCPFYPCLMLGATTAPAHPSGTSINPWVTFQSTFPVFICGERTPNLEVGAGAPGSECSRTLAAALLSSHTPHLSRR